jgi:hypothetical protein
MKYKLDFFFWILNFRVTDMVIDPPPPTLKIVPNLTEKLSLWVIWVQPYLGKDVSEKKIREMSRGYLPQLVKNDHSL